jgi:hypothetical protein
MQQGHDGIRSRRKHGNDLSIEDFRSFDFRSFDLDWFGHLFMLIAVLVKNLFKSFFLRGMLRICDGDGDGDDGFAFVYGNGVCDLCPD